MNNSKNTLTLQLNPDSHDEEEYSDFESEPSSDEDVNWNEVVLEQMHNELELISLHSAKIRIQRVMKFTDSGRANSTDHANIAKAAASINKILAGVEEQLKKD